MFYGIPTHCDLIAVSLQQTDDLEDLVALSSVCMKDFAQFLANHVVAELKSEVRALARLCCSFLIAYFAFGEGELDACCLIAS